LFSPPTATTPPHTLSLHDALPIFRRFEREPHPLHALVDLLRREAFVGQLGPQPLAQPLRQLVAKLFFQPLGGDAAATLEGHAQQDRKSTRLNSSHLGISYAVFCLK